MRVAPGVGPPAADERDGVGGKRDDLGGCGVALRPDGGGGCRLHLRQADRLEELLRLGREADLAERVERKPA